MSDYSSLPVLEDTKATLADLKRDDESWDALLQRLAARETDGEMERVMDMVAIEDRFDDLESRLDDFETTAPRQIADELTTQLR